MNEYLLALLLEVNAQLTIRIEAYYLVEKFCQKKVSESNSRTARR